MAILPIEWNGAYYGEDRGSETAFAAAGTRSRLLVAGLTLG